jgi:hypothetical protein
MAHAREPQPRGPPSREPLPREATGLIKRISPWSHVGRQTKFSFGRPAAHVYRSCACFRNPTRHGLLI